MSQKNNIVRIPVRILNQGRLNIEKFEIIEDSIDFILEKPFQIKKLDIPYWENLRQMRFEKEEREIPDGLPSFELSVNKRTLEYLSAFTKDDASLDYYPISEETADALINVAGSANKIEQDQALVLAQQVMRKTSLISYNGYSYLLSTHSSYPTILAQVEENEKNQGIIEILHWAEVIIEILFGLLALLGMKLNRNINAGKWIKRLADIINRNKKIKNIIEKIALNGAKLLSAKDIFDLLLTLWMEGFTKDCLKESLLDILDISFWAIIWLIAKIGSRFIPGLGQALLLADLGILVTEVVLKLKK